MIFVRSVLKAVALGVALFGIQSGFANQAQFQFHYDLGKNLSDFGEVVGLNPELSVVATYRSIPAEMLSYSWVGEKMQCKGPIGAPTYPGDDGCDAGWETLTWKLVARVRVAESTFQVSNLSSGKTDQCRDQVSALLTSDEEIASPGVEPAQLPTRITLRASGVMDGVSAYGGTVCILKNTIVPQQGRVEMILSQIGETMKSLRPLVVTNGKVSFGAQEWSDAVLQKFFEKTELTYIPGFTLRNGSFVQSLVNSTQVIAKRK